AEIKQLVAAHQIPRVETEDYYNFQDGTQIRRIEVTPELRRRLIAGEIAIVRCEGRFAFVPAAIGEQIGERVPKALLHLNRPQDAPAEDDPYKDYAVPDDLMWELAGHGRGGGDAQGGNGFRRMVPAATGR